jgi:hypothetical protein
VASGLSSQVAALIRLASRLICLIVIASFVIFVVHQASDASNTQQNEVNSSGPPNSREAQLPTSSSTDKKSTVHKAIDDASDEFTSPFHAVTSGSSNQWVIRGANLVLSLLVYGFGLGFLARVMRVRV